MRVGEKKWYDLFIIGGRLFLVIKSLALKTTGLGLVMPFSVDMEAAAVVRIN